MNKDWIKAELEIIKHRLGGIAVAASDLAARAEEGAAYVEDVLAAIEKEYE